MQKFIEALYFRDKHPYIGESSAPLKGESHTVAEPRRIVDRLKANVKLQFGAATVVEGELRESSLRTKNFVRSYSSESLDILTDHLKETDPMISC